MQIDLPQSRSRGGRLLFEPRQPFPVEPRGFGQRALQAFQVAALAIRDFRPRRVPLLAQALQPLLALQQTLPQVLDSGAFHLDLPLAFAGAPAELVPGALVGARRLFGGGQERVGFGLGDLRGGQFRLGGGQRLQPVPLLGPVLLQLV